MHVDVAKFASMCSRFFCGTHFSWRLGANGMQGCVYSLWSHAGLRLWCSMAALDAFSGCSRTRTPGFTMLALRLAELFEIHPFGSQSFSCGVGLCQPEAFIHFHPRGDMKHFVHIASYNMTMHVNVFVSNSGTLSYILTIRASSMPRHWLMVLALLERSKNQRVRPHVGMYFGLI